MGKSRGLRFARPRQVGHLCRYTKLLEPISKTHFENNFICTNLTSQSYFNMLCCILQGRGQRGRNWRMLVFPCSPLRGSQPHSNLPLQASTRFARFGLPLTHCTKERGKPLRGLDGIPSGTLQNPSTGRVLGQTAV